MGHCRHRKLESTEMSVVVVPWNFAHTNECCLECGLWAIAAKNVRKLKLAIKLFCLRLES